MVKAPWTWIYQNVIGFICNFSNNGDSVTYEHNMHTFFLTKPRTWYFCNVTLCRCTDGCALVSLFWVLYTPRFLWWALYKCQVFRIHPAVATQQVFGREASRLRVVLPGEPILSPSSMRFLEDANYEIKKKKGRNKPVHPTMVQQ